MEEAGFVRIKLALFPFKMVLEGWDQGLRWWWWVVLVVLVVVTGGDSPSGNHCGQPQWGFI